jgi:uncharacterized Zn-binding protein involved in type VI secretion
MNAQAAARLGDEIAHGFGVASMIAGAVVGAVIGAAVVAATAATGGLAAVIIGGAIAYGGLSTFQIVKGISTIFNLPEPATGKLIRGSPDVFINNRNAMRAGEDVAASCSGFPISHPYWPFPVKIVEGSATVFINNKHAARISSKMACGAHIKSGSPDTFIGGPTARMGFVLDIESWLHTGLEVLGLTALAGGTVLAAAAGAAALGIFAATSGGIMVGMEALGDLGDRLGPGYRDLLQGVAGMTLLGLSPKMAKTEAARKYLNEVDPENAVPRDRNAISRLSDKGEITKAQDILKPHVDNKDVQGIVDRLDVGGVPKDKGFLWSGDKEGARAIATDRGGMTLEGTRGGKVIDNWDYLNEKMPWDQGGEQVWGGASENYTSQLEGNVTALQTPDKAARGGGDIFKTYEWPKVRDGLDSGRITDFNIEIIPEP